MYTGNLSGGSAGDRAFSAIKRYRDISREVFWHAHPTTIRMLLALASAGWAIILFLDPFILYQWPYQIMPLVMSPQLWMWGFILYFAGIFWRIFDGNTRTYWALGINLLGCFLWVTLTVCITLRTDRVIPGSCLEIVTSLFAVWSLIRTGLGKDVGTP